VDPAVALFDLVAVDNFGFARSIQRSDVSAAAIATVRTLDEKVEMEPWVQAILHDTNRTPHGPSEVVDILTHKVAVRGRTGLAAFILKGKSFPTVRPAHVGHQILRLPRILDLSYAVFAASGDVLDEVKEQFIATATQYGWDYCFLDADDLARLFVAFGFICPRDGQRTTGGRCQCGYTPSTRTSNILQQEALRELAATHQLKQRAGVIVLPTGAGKTRVAIIDAHAVGAQRCVYVAHAHEILISAEEEFLRHFAEEEVRRFDGPPRQSELRRINLVTVQSLAKHLNAFRGMNVDYLILDEFHHAAARSYRRVIKTLDPDFLLGLTATPFRGDRQDVLALCGGNTIVNFELRQGIDFGVLCPYNYFGCFDNIDYSDITYKGSRYDIRDLERALVIPERDAAVIAKWREKADGKPTLAFCCSQLHAERVAYSFQSQGILAETYLASTPSDRRAHLRNELRLGAVKVLCVVDVLNEGVDLPFVECLLFLRPTESKRIFFQQLGRGLRRFVGKDVCTVIDFIGNFKNAYRIVENLGLEPEEYEASFFGPSGAKWKEILNLPTGCSVEFDDRVIDVFADETLNPAFITRHNIRRILIYLYEKVERRVARKPTRDDIDMNSVLGSDIYVTAYGSWKAFEDEIGRRSDGDQ
jgi:superfamily II DNA or RNA helicase